MSKVANLSTTRKVVGSLAIAGTAAAVAGLGTFGTFTSSTTPVTTQVSTGTVGISGSQPTGSYAIPSSVTGFVPGDSLTRTFTLTNTGTSPLASISLASQLTTSSNALTSDTTNGLQMLVKACSVAYTQGGTSTSPSYTCSGTERTVMSGPAVNNTTLVSPAALSPGKSDNMIFTVSLPTTADNTFQGLTAGLSLTFTGVQATGSAK